MHLTLWVPAPGVPPKALCLATNMFQVAMHMALVDAWSRKTMPVSAKRQMIVIFILLFDLIIYMAHSDDPDWHIMRALRCVPPLPRAAPRTAA